MRRILIADDHAIYRQGMRTVLAAELHDAEFSEARDAREVLAEMQHGPWDLLMLDITLPGRSGLDLLPEIRNLQSGVRALITSMHPEEEFGVRALRAGAAGYIWKQSPLEELLAAVRCVLDGGRYIGPRLAAQLAVDMEHGGQPRHASLSGREFEVFRSIASGANPKTIAGDLALSPKTVSTYRTRLLTKLCLKTDADVVRYALQHHLVE